MKIAILHDSDAAGPPEDPVIGQLESALTSAGHEAQRLTYGDQIEALVHELLSSKPDLVFNLAESFAGRSALESNVAGLLNLMGLRYTGSSPAGLLLAGDKSLAKKIFAFHGLPSPKFSTMYRGTVDWSGEIGFPLIVKPPQEDASLGISGKSVVADLKELLDAVSALQAEYQSPVLVEEFIDGREFYVGVLGNASPEALPIIELDFTGFPADRPRIASWEAKWGDEGDARGAEYMGNESVFPENLDEALAEKIRSTALQAFQALRLRDYARVDLRVTEAGDVYVIEVNPNCYLESDSEFARAAARAGIAHEQLVLRIVELAQARYAR
ncbi:MAG TPA: ATP-grasp domain-containing protein [Gemmatimonadaceae bacterium]